MSESEFTRRALLRTGAAAIVSSGHGGAIPVSGSSDQPARVEQLRCEYAENPIGIDVVQPRFSWRLASSERGQKQTAYNIKVVDEGTAGKRVVWDTGKVPSSDCIQIEYAGAPLRSRGRYSWIVTVWDRDQKPIASGRAYWEMAFLTPDEWRAQWIGFPAGRNGRALYFRKEFEIAQAIRKARIYVVGLGYYQLHINGKCVGDRVLDPAFTDYEKRVLYSVFDVSEVLNGGGNAIGVVVGNGWYGVPKLLLQLEVTLSDNTMQTIYTSHDTNHDMVWRVSSGPIVANSIYDGEQYDARLEKPAWNMFSMPEDKELPRSESWITANAVSAPGGRLVSASAEPIRIVQSFHPKSRTSPQSGVYVFDTGQNLAGWVQLRVKGTRGDRITLRFAETLLPDGSVNQANLRTAAATDQYICRGSDVEIWEPLFTYHGFRYIQVEGCSDAPSLDSLLVRVVRSSVDSNGIFNCSDPLLNRIHKMVWWTENSNLYSIPTDCPQRDERMGWMNDLTVRLDESIYNFQLPSFYNNFLNDVSDGQNSEGAIADTAPLRWGTQPADPVSVSYLLLGYFLYRYYGDKRALANHFEGFRQWVEYLHSRTKADIVTFGYYGDWSPPARFGITEGSPVSKNTPRTYMSTGYLYYSARLLAQMAGVIGKNSEEQRYKQMADRVAEAFQRNYWDSEKGGYCSNNQACNSFALFLGLVPTENVARVVKNLADDVEAQGTHLTTGNLCTKYVLEMLSEHGHHDLALALVTQRSYPSWGYMLDSGATTVWERWENMTGGQMNSHNHPMLGSVGAWFYKYLAGIRMDQSSAGGKRLVIRPLIPQRLDSASAQYTTMYGTVRSSWRREAESLHLSITVPPNSTADIYIPKGETGTITESAKPVRMASGVTSVVESAGDAVISVESGSYEFLSE